MILGTDGEKMSKSRGNVINPDDIVDTYGADALRLYEMFMGPLEATKPWQTEQVSRKSGLSVDGGKWCRSVQGAPLRCGMFLGGGRGDSSAEPRRALAILRSFLGAYA